jgi:hypothetical protein
MLNPARKGWETRRSTAAPKSRHTPLNLENPYPIKYQRKLSLLHLAA